MHPLSAAAEPLLPVVELWSDQTLFGSPPIDDIRIRLSSAGGRLAFGWIDVLLRKRG